MDNIEEKLKQYRVRKRRQERFENFKQKFKHFLMLGVQENIVGDGTVVRVEDEETLGKLIKDTNEVSDIPSPNSDDELSVKEIDDGSIAPQENRVYKYLTWTVYFMFWITLYIIAIELQFGIVFLMFSALFGIYLNTRTGPKRPNEISAYSVFNKNCESIDGTLKAEQFEREIRYGAGGVK